MIDSVKFYVDKIISEHTGMKALLLDEETVRPCRIPAAPDGTEP